MQRSLLLMGLFLFGVMAFAQESSVTEADLAAIVADYLEATGPGMVVYVVDYEEVYTVAFGLADIDANIPIQTDDYFRIASMTKPMLAVTVLSLVEDSELDLDDPLADYLPDEIVANIENTDTATIRQALQMTSGITDYLNNDDFFDAVYDDPQWWTAESSLEYAYGLPADFAPGTSYEYSNSNYNLLQIVIETVTGEALADVMAARVFEPAEMDTCYLETEATFSENIVRGYSADGDEYEDVTNLNDGLGMGDGGVVCTAADLAKFLPALVNEDMIGAEMLEAMLTPTDDGSGGGYGLGIGVDSDEDGGIVIEHAGATNGFEGVMSYVVEEDLLIVVLSNLVDNDAVEAVAEDVLLLAYGEY